MEIKLDSINFQEVFTAAIMQSLDSDKKEQLIKGALQFLITKPSSGYQSKSPIQDAFEMALRAETIQVARDYLKNSEEVTKALEGLIVDAVKKITTDARDKTVDKIADKIIEGLYSDKY
jgi:hypothetical protein